MLDPTTKPMELFEDPPRPKQGWLSKMFSWILLRIFVRVNGVRFFAQASHDGGRLIGTSVFTGYDGKTVVFRYYRKELTDIVMSMTRRTLVRESYYSYMVEAEFSSSFPKSLKKYNSMKFVIRRDYFRYLSEPQILHLLLDFFVTFVQHEVTDTKLTFLNSQNK